MAKGKLNRSWRDDGKGAKVLFLSRTGHARRQLGGASRLKADPFSVFSV
jgi:hypothetical protein